MRHFESGFRIIKVNKKAVAVAIGAMFSVGAQAADISGIGGYNGGTSTLSITADSGAAISFDGAGQTLELNSTGGAFTNTGDVNAKAGGVRTGTIEFKSGGGNTAKITGNVDQSTGSAGSTISLKVTASAASGDTAGQITGTATVTNVTFAADGGLTIGGVTSITGAVDNTVGANGKGTLTIGGNATIAGSIGSTNSLAGVSLSGAGTNDLQGAVIKAGYVDISGSGTLKLSGGAAVTGNITTSTTNTGTLQISGSAAQITGNIGANGGNALLAVSLGESLTVNGAGTVDAKGVAFTADKTFTTGSGTTTIGTNGVTNTSGAAAGTLTLMGATTVAGNVGLTGVGALKALNVGAGTTSFNGGAQVFATTTTLNGTSTVTFANGLSGTTLAFGAQNGTVVVTTGNLDANVTATNTGTLKLNGVSTVSGTVGASGSAIANLEAGAGGAVVFSATSAPVYATTTTIKGNNNVTFSGGLSGTTLAFGNTTATVKIGAGTNLAAATTSTGGTTGKGTVQFLGATTLANAIGTTANVLTKVQFDTGAVSIGGDMYAADSASSIEIGAASAATATYTASKAFGGGITLSNSSVLDMGVYKLTGDNTANIGSSLTTTTGSTIKTTLNTITGTDTANFGNIVLRAGAGSTNGTGKATIVAGTKVYVTVGTGLNIANGTKYTIVDGAVNGGVATLTDGNITTNSSVLTFTQDTSSTQDLIIQASRASYSTAASLSAGATGSSAGTVLTDLANAGTATGDMATVLTTLDTYSATQLSTEIKKLAPVANNSISVAAIAAVSSGLNTVATRLASVRGDVLAAADGETGLAAGNAGYSRAFWMRAFGASNKQNMRDGFDGYKARSSGISFGADTEVSDGLTMGAALTYASTMVDQQDTRQGDSTEIKSYQLTGYGSKEFGLAYVDGMVAYAQHKNKASRATALSRTAKGDYDSDQWIARLGGGYRINIAEKMQFVPLATLEWSSLKQHAYTETNADALNLSYGANTTTRVRSGLGARLGTETTWNGTTVRPEVHAVWHHDFKDAGTDTTANFTGGGAAFTTTGQKIAKDSYNLGGGLSFLPGKTSKVTLGYDYEGRSGFNGQSIQVTGRWDF